MAKVKVYKFTADDNMQGTKLPKRPRSATLAGISRMRGTALLDTEREVDEDDIDAFGFAPDEADEK